MHCFTFFGFFSKGFLFRGRAELQSPGCNASLPPPSTVANMPPTLSLGREAPLYEYGECSKTYVCTGGARCVRGPGGRWPCQTCSHTQVHTPGPRAWVRVSTTRLPRGRGRWVPQGQESIGACEAPGRGNTFARDMRVSVRGGNTCARVGLRPEDPLLPPPLKLSSAV